jgi:RNA polymerase sigma factor (sigma-70 family)
MNVDIIKYVKANHIKLNKTDILDLFQDRTANHNTIIKSQLALVYHLSESYTRTTHLELDELFSVGLEALNYAYEKFTPNKENGASFTTYAMMVIKSRFNCEIHSNKIIPIPRYFEGEAKPRAYTFTALSTSNDDESENYITNTLADDADINYQFVTNEDKLIELIQDKLQPKFSDIVIKVLGLGLDEKVKQNEIAKELGLTKQRIGQMYHLGLNKLKESPGFKARLNDLYQLN